MKDWKYKKAEDFGSSGDERLKSLRREATLIEFFSGSIWRLLARSYLRLFHGFEVSGRENIPTSTPFVIVANHQSHLDAICIGAVLSEKVASSIFPIAAHDTFFTSRTKSLLTALTVNALPLSRKDSKKSGFEIEELRSRLISGTCGYILFPEGTRSRTGELGMFKRGIGKLVAESSIPVVPCYLEGCFEAFPPGAVLPKSKKVKASFAPALTFESIENDSKGWEMVASQLQQAVSAAAIQSP